MRTSQKTNPDRKRKKKRESVKRQVFVKYMQERLAIAVIAITLALFALIYVLYNIVENNRDSYNQIVLTQQDYDSRSLAYRRGDIVDRNGTYLATTEKVYNLILDPKVILSNKDKYLATTVSVLNQTFGYDTGELTRLIEDNPKKSYINYEKQLTQDQKEAFEANTCLLYTSDAADE